MLDLKELISKVLTALLLKSITLTHTSNNYVNATNFANIKAYRLGNLAMFIADVRPSTSLPSNSTWVNIGTLPYNTVNEVGVTIPSQANVNARVLFDITTSGIIRIYNGSGTATGTNYFRGICFAVLDI